MAISVECNARQYYGTYELKHPMTPSSSPVREVSGQEEDCPDSTTAPEHDHPQRPEDTDEEPRPKDHPADTVPRHNQTAPAVAELEGLSLKIDNFGRGESEVVEAVSDGEETKDTYTSSQAQATASPFDDPEEGSQTSSEESWASLPPSSSGSSSSNASTDEQREEGGKDDEDAPETADTPSGGGPLPSPETTFRFYKFHEEFKEHEAQDNEEDDDVDDDDDENDDPRFSPTGPWASSAVPRWAFLRSSNSLPVLNLGPRDFYHGGSALRHEVSADEDDEGDGYLAENRGSRDVVAMVGVAVHL
ncbi:hypothetical protein KVR01_008822 [Diaporthe batatas]|uniref:uncharacterized protein n=1 Tax=Diaporthe batatas TaxID=748121 RepID=UPI001D05B2E1|nr:uncharacterized protein KVR01_008822 [Diaporthe batatas]KAG8161835.1 hypothetical protein KVR01_008822 [Diaporthe batatas]